jgi:hypothetical protein
MVEIKNKLERNEKESLLKSQTFWATNDFITNLMLHNKHFWKIWYYTSQKDIDHYLLLKAHG